MKAHDVSKAEHALKIRVSQKKSVHNGTERITVTQERLVRRNSFKVTSSAVGGAALAGAGLGILLGPVGAVVGMAVGGVAGELLDLKVESRRHISDRGSHEETLTH